jgi:hypothetical protein
MNSHGIVSRTLVNMVRSTLKVTYSSFQVYGFNIYRLYKEVAYENKNNAVRGTYDILWNFYILCHNEPIHPWKW